MMQTPLDPSLLLYLLLAAFLLAALVYLTRSRGIHGSFINDDEGEQNASKAEIQAPGGINSAFINRRKGKQNLESAKINCGESSSGENSEVYHIRNILLQLIAYLFGGGQYPPNKGKQI